MEDKYLEYVSEEAKKFGKLFFLDTGEGNDFLDKQNDMYIEDLSGWLIEDHLGNQFIKDRKNENVYEKYKNYYVFVKWKRDSFGNLEIRFQQYGIIE